MSEYEIHHNDPGRFWSSRGPELADALVTTVGRIRALNAEVLDLVSELGAEGIHRLAGYGSQAHFLTALVRVSPRQAKRLIGQAEQVRETRTPTGHSAPAPLPATRAALVAGVIDGDHVDVIAKAMSEIPDWVDAPARVEFEHALAERSRTADPAELRAGAERMLAVLDQDGPEPDHRARPERGNTLSWARRRDGRVHGRFELRPVDGATFETLMEVLAAPRRSVGDPRQDAVAGGESGQAEPDRHRPNQHAVNQNSPNHNSANHHSAYLNSANQNRADLNSANRNSASQIGAYEGRPGANGPNPGHRDERSRAERNGDAFAEVCLLALGCHDLPSEAGDRPHLHLTASVDTLRRQTGQALLDNGVAVSAAELRIKACDCAVIPYVMGGASRPLDVGRLRYTIPSHLRRALILRDQGCAHPGCDRRPRSCHGHHIREWALGGRTGLDNLVLLCDRHHRLVHNSEWKVAIVAGLPEFTPPAYLDPTRTPLRNTIHARAA